MKKMIFFGLFGIAFLILLSLGIILPESQEGTGDESVFSADFQKRSYPQEAVSVFVTQQADVLEPQTDILEIVETTEVVTETGTTRTVKRTTFAKPEINKPLTQRTDRGEVVVELQELLVENGAEIQVDGIFGDE